MGLRPVNCRFSPIRRGGSVAESGLDELVVVSMDAVAETPPWLVTGDRHGPHDLADLAPPAE